MKIERFALGALWTNAYLVYESGGSGFFVDPGGDPEEALGLIKDENISLEYVLLTHGHADHIAGLEKIRGLAASGVLIHEDDASMLENPESNLSAFVGEKLSLHPAETLFRDGDIFRVGSLSIKVIHTPGHTRGSSCFFVEEPGQKGILLSGDTLFAGSVGRTDLPGGDMALLESSIGRLSFLADDIDVLPGHGPATTIGAERAGNPFWPEGKS
ncbi:MAG TPA: MBL fold metallo-hydrolase [Synergistales bacterium]|jgi:glyoxylase-like metal-dependent hydrolase (beta-lactamase superfamily II)|nr:MBL fold metallo-hydrolase [Synergistales bacterium]